MSNYATQEKPSYEKFYKNGSSLNYTYSEFNLHAADRYFFLAHQFDVVYLFTTERLLNGTFNLMLEPLTDYDVFEVDGNNRSTYHPLVSSDYPVAYFELSEPFYHRRYEKYIDPDLSARHKSGIRACQH